MSRTTGRGGDYLAVGIAGILERESASVWISDEEATLVGSKKQRTVTSSAAPKLSNVEKNAMNFVRQWRGQVRPRVPRVEGVKLARGGWGVESENKNIDLIVESESFELELGVVCCSTPKVLSFIFSGCAK